MLILKRICCVALSIFLTISIAEAKPKKRKSTRNIVTHTQTRPQTSIIADARTGTVLHSENADRRIYPASLTKMMTLYMVFDALKQKKISLNTMLPVSKHAQSMRPSKLGLVNGQKISVGDAIMALIVKSANDVAVVVAEGLGGTEASFARAMNNKAKVIGMHKTHFVNASGWHDSRQVTTAVDMAKLGLALKRDFPGHYPLFKKTSFAFHGKVINGHNHVLKQYAGAEGLKTGYTGPAGFNLVTTASKMGMSLIGVVTGGSSAHSRDKKMMALLDKHFGVENVKYVALDNKTKVLNKKSVSKKSINKKGHNVKLASNAANKKGRNVKLISNAANKKRANSV
jgi:D-alanyl-D-alanine carboxypeptidase (penicillin-binding protein 5/6)